MLLGKEIKEFKVTINKQDREIYIQNSFFD
jgi:hypothetical protein